MPLTSRPAFSRASGFSLLEMVVALAVLGLALGALYQAATGATRNVTTDEKYAYAVELAQSLLVDNGAVPAAGVNQQGRTESGFEWSVLTQPIELGRGARKQAVLHEIEVAVGWREGGKRRQVTLNSVVEGYDE